LLLVIFINETLLTDNPDKPQYKPPLCLQCRPEK